MLCTRTAPCPDLIEVVRKLPYAHMKKMDMTINTKVYRENGFYIFHPHRIINNSFILFSPTLLVHAVLLFCLFFSRESFAADTPLYGVFETSVTNSNTYTNPFNYTEIELDATFTSPSGIDTNFFGFHNGDGNGGQTGNVWTVRFMPNEVGTWTYNTIWSDGKTAGSSGKFSVTDTGLIGPVRIASDNGSFFMDSRGNPLHFRGYDMHHFGPVIGNTGSDWSVISGDWTAGLNTYVISRGYNFVMMDSPSQLGVSRSYWFDRKTDIFDVAVWTDYEKILDYALANNIYLFPFDGIVGQQESAKLTSNLLRYIVARFSPYASYFGFSPTWEWADIWSRNELNSYMTQIDEGIPFYKLLTAHDRSSDALQWLDFSMRQKQSRTIFDGNCRACGKNGGVAASVVNLPIIASEDLWENAAGAYGHPRNATEVRQGTWGIMMAGVLPLYSEWYRKNKSPGDMPGEPEFRRALDFFYANTRYREYTMLNDLVSATNGQIASGITGQEYLVYDRNGGDISISLQGINSTTKFSTTWYNPITDQSIGGASVQGGGTATLTSPYSSESVLLLKMTDGQTDTLAPNAPQNFKITP